MPLSHENRAEKGLVFNIQRFSVHDGPGIRTTVFMKGCPLRCLWCSNPESQDFFPSLVVRNINCKGCGACLDACPKGAIVITPEAGRQIDMALCNQCMRCVDACLYDSLRQCGTYMGANEIMEEILQDEPFYANSGGGVTVSGGEPLFQSRFVSRLLKNCKAKGLHTALETTGQTPWKEMAMVLRWTDLILYDIKHLYGLQHKNGAGINNGLILKNLDRAARITPIWLRVPLIAGFNDSEQHIEQVGELGKRINVRKISLLPYHEGGKSKCEQMGRKYRYDHGKAPEKEHIDKLRRIIEKIGLPASIGS